MIDEKYNCIVLRAIDYRDNDKLVTLYAQGKGKIAATMRGCKSPKSKLKYASAPLCFGEYEFILKNGRYTVVGCECYDTFYSLTQKIERYYAALAALDMINRFTYDGEPQDRLFILSLTYLRELAYGEADCNGLLAYFLVRSMHESGYAIGVEKCAVCGNCDISRMNFSMRDGGIVCSDCRKGVPISRGAIELISNIKKRDDIESYASESIDGAAAKETVALIYKYIQSVTDEKLLSLSQYLQIFG